MHRLRTVTYLDVSAVAGHHAMPAGLLLFPAITLKCLSIGTLNIINFPFVSNGKLMVFRCHNIQEHYYETVICLKIMNFPFGTNGKFIIFWCPNT